jgi:hypothetical protein
MRTDTPTPTRLVTRRLGARVGAVDEYAALQVAAVDRLVHSGLEVTAATARLRASARQLADDLGLDDVEVRESVAPVVAATELALRDVQEEFHRLTLQVLRMGRYRLGLC